MTYLSQFYHNWRSHNLTDCLDWIEENLGVTGDAAILIISLLNLTAGGVA